MSNPRDLRTAALIVFASLAMSAFFLAQGTTGLLAAVLLPLREAPPPSIDRAEAARLARRQTTSDETILRRNIFDPITGDLFAEPVDPNEAGPEETVVVAPWAPGDPTEACSGTPLRLVGAVVSPNSPSWSFAAIVEGTEKAMLYRVGMTVGAAEILEIARDRVIVRSGSTPACHVAMFGEEPAVAGATPPPATPAEEPSEGAPEATGEGIERVGTNEYKVDRAILAGVMGDQAALMRMARVIPQEENGRTVGVKLYGVRRSSLLGRLGIRNGDMLRDINGLDLSSPDAALQAYAQLPTATDVTVNLQRRGQDIAMKYHLSD